MERVASAMTDRVEVAADQEVYREVECHTVMNTASLENTSVFFTDDAEIPCHLCPQRSVGSSTRSLSEAV
ncbi:hypothetical protein QR680_002901 [Steinernema hermaphroditum]|uniref:Uncharacterized protein n=1 Tax=Steinernema hermaphroditum TaxID=289476 RepID=A0AA39H5F1_9BILA|nr:hypothetical protein QR680_002901 [Steinernema hermaphroditum]